MPRDDRRDVRKNRDATYQSVSLSISGMNFTKTTGLSVAPEHRAFSGLRTANGRALETPLGEASGNDPAGSP